jgi:hypothetical protein
MNELQRKLSTLSCDLTKWERQSFGNVQIQIRRLQRELEIMWELQNRVGPSTREEDVKTRLTELLDQEEVMWQQRSRVQWLAAGDKNTRFFHLRASQRRRKNKIKELIRGDGTLETREAVLGDMTSDFYKDLYKTEGVQGIEKVLDTVPMKVTSLMNEMLDAPFDTSEVKAALFEMYPTKAPGPDRFPTHFFQRNWELCGVEVKKSVLRILSGVEDPAVVNKTFIVMIPKIASPRELGQFRPISICDVIYKIASKVAANRLKKILTVGLCPR